MPEADLAPPPFAAEPLDSDENVRLADSAVTQIFEMMFGLTIAPDIRTAPARPAHGLEERTAIVGFSGTMRGSCQIRMTCAAAEAVASAMLGGMPIDGNDESINDALGELCNMLAGGWKNAIPELAADCSLSPPTIVGGVSYSVHTSKAQSRLCRSYTFAEHTLNLALYREESR